jgi:XRE family transcriptional regulator, regulator of sulfur utilization
MKRVHRNLTRQEIDALRKELESLVPECREDVPAVLRRMRFIAKLSQAEYARLCRVSLGTISKIESGVSDPSIGTLEKLLKPFGFTVGVVRNPAVWSPQA